MEPACWLIASLTRKPVITLALLRASWAKPGKILSANRSMTPRFWLLDTAMAAEIPAAIREKYLRAMPIGRMATPDEIAAVVAFLASDAASYLAGTTIDANGGLY